MTATQVRTALLSVSDKTNIIPFAQKLHHLGIQLISTGGTAELLRKNQIAVKDVSEVTHFPEMMSGRLKTLHPMIHGGILGRRDQDTEVMEKYEIPFIDLVIVNLYPFEKTIASADCTLSSAIENIDIGGPAMIRSAAKNHAWVGVVVSPSSYEAIALELENNHCQLSKKTKEKLAKEAFIHTAEYDTLIAHYLSQHFKEFENLGNSPLFPERFSVSFNKKQSLRYGENPHQAACLYASPNFSGTNLAQATLHQGVALSYNNLADADAALACVSAFQTPACVIVKHANPCGVGLDNHLLEAYQKAFASDPTSAFGGIIAFNQVVNLKLLETILKQQFVEVIIAPYFEKEALEAAKTKPNVRLLAIGDMNELGANPWHYHTISGGLLVQTHDNSSLTLADCRVVTERIPSDSEKKDAWFVWQVCRFVKSNAIVIGREGQTLGIGAGQMSRVMSTKIATWQAEQQQFSTKGASLASDAFFPFKDSIEAAAKAGITCIIQPGGSKRDTEVINAANQHNISMLFTAIRHFKHS